MHQGIGEANVGRVPTAVNGSFGVNTAAVREVLVVVVVVNATCRGTRYDVLLRRHDDVAQQCISRSGEARAEGTGGSTKGITPRVTRDQVGERRGFQRSATCGEAMLANHFHAETTVAEAKALHGVATMAVAKAPQRARMRFDADGKGAGCEPSTSKRQLQTRAASMLNVAVGCPPSSWGRGDKFARWGRAH